MTERKPAHVDPATWAEAQIRAAQQRGEFDDLPGAGRPLPGRGEPVNEMWWINAYLEREQLSGELMLPTPLRLRRQVQRLPDEVRDLPTEQMVRAAATALNGRIAQWLRAPSGPWFPVGPVDVEEVVRQWRACRDATAAAAEQPAPPAAPASRRRRWWSPWSVTVRRRPDRRT